MKKPLDRIYIFKTFANLFVAFFIWIICLFLLTSFNKPNKHLKLLNATYSHWTGGMGGGGATDYFFNIKVLTDQKIEFDSLWVNNMALKAFLANKKPVLSKESKKYKKNDTISVRASLYSNQKQTGIVKAPIAYKGDALLRYYINKSPQYLIIKSIILVNSPKQP